MSLDAIGVHDDWKERARLQQKADQRRWRSALFAVACSLVLATLMRNVPALPYVRLLLVDGVALSLYLAVGAWANGPSSQRRVVAFSSVYVVLVAGLFLGVVVIQRADSLSGSHLAVGLGLAWSMMIIPGWGALCYGLMGSPSETLGRGVHWVWWLRAVLWGLLGGVFVTVYLALSARFGWLVLSRLETPSLFLAHRLVYIVGIRCAGEELLFRGAVFHVMHERRGKGFWVATLVSLPLNLAIYVAAMPPAQSPAAMTILLLSPCVMIVANSALYLRQRSLVPPLISNGVLQVANLVLTAQ
jgi:hypothetical protein